MRLNSRALPAAGARVALALAGGVLASTTGVSNRRSRAVAAETDTTRTISVSGEGRVSLAPDTVMMTLGVDIRNAELGAAQVEASATMDAVIASLEAAGVAEADIQTGSYNINIERDYNQPTQPLIGYLVSHTVIARVRQIDRAGSTIEAAVSAGANNVGGVWFALENPAGAIKQARELAIVDARAKAQELARLTDSTLGPVQSIAEGYIPAQATARNSIGGDYANESMALKAPSINPGQTEVVLSVSVVYAIS